MLIEQQVKQFKALNEWFEFSLGKSIADEFIKQFHPVLDYLKGETLLQLGSCSDNPWLTELQFKHKWITSPFDIKGKIDLVSSLSQIPLNRNSVDCILAPLTMEAFPNSLNLIDEIDRVLKPMGYVVFLSINPWSLWGGALKCGLVHCFADRSIKLHTPLHLNRIFLQRGYRQCSLNNFCYIPPISNKTLLKKFTFFNEVGKMLWPFPSGFYCYIAQKYEQITPSLIPELVVEDTLKSYETPFQPAAN